MFDFQLERIREQVAYPQYIFNDTWMDFEGRNVSFWTAGYSLPKFCFAFLEEFIEIPVPFLKILVPLPLRVSISSADSCWLQLCTRHNGSVEEHEDCRTESASPDRRQRSVSFED